MDAREPQCLALVPHPDNPANSVRTLTVRARRGSEPGALHLLWRLEGTLTQLVIPEGTARGERRDELWRHTCFEAFMRSGSDPAYHEFNFAPSGHWAAYRFEDLRRGMAALALARAPRIEVRRGPHALELEVQVEAACAPSCFLGLTAVIEQRNGTLSYWALRHPRGRPDFHHPDGCAIEL